MIVREKVLILLTVIFAIYAGISFIEWNYNPAVWGWAMRFWFVFISMIATGFILSLVKDGEL